MSTRPSSWPGVVGALTIAMGVLGILGAACATILPTLTGRLWSSAEFASFQAVQRDVTARWNWWTIPASLVAVGLGVLALVAGIALLRRRRWARTAALTWAILVLLQTIVGSAVGYVIQRQMFDALGDKGWPGPATARGMSSVFSASGLCLGLVWGAALPVFLLIWLSREKVRREIADWS